MDIILRSSLLLRKEALSIPWKHESMFKNCTPTIIAMLFYPYENIFESDYLTRFDVKFT